MVRRRYDPILTRGVILCVLIAIALCVWSSAFSAAGATDPLRVAAVTVSTPLTALFDRIGGGVARGIAATFGRDAQYNEWMEQKAALEKALAEHREQLAELSSLREQNEQLRAYLALTEQHTSLVLTEARVIYTADTSSRLLTLDRGSRHGIEVGMPVLSANGLIGRVWEVMPHSCKVATLFHEKLAVGVRDARSGVSGTLSVATDADGVCYMTDMDANMDRATALAVGDIIVTSGYGGNFPADIAVGVIVEKGFDPLDRTPYALVAPYADVSDTAELYMIVTDVTVETQDPTAPTDPKQEDDGGESPEPTEPTDPSEGDTPAPEQPSAGESDATISSETIPSETIPSDPIDPQYPNEAGDEEVAA